MHPLIQMRSLYVEILQDFNGTQESKWFLPLMFHL
jgi:hypothetical protein